MNILEHKGIRGTLELDEESKLIFGKLIGVNGVVMYEGENVTEFYKNFITAVDEYITICEENNFPLKKEFKGVFNVRTTPEIHEQLNSLSVRTGVKINTIVNSALQHFLTEKLPDLPKAHCRSKLDMFIHTNDRLTGWKYSLPGITSDVASLARKYYDLEKEQHAH